MSRKTPGNLAAKSRDGNGQERVLSTRSRRDQKRHQAGATIENEDLRG